MLNGKSGDIWIIELDERDQGGTLKTIATYPDVASAMAAWGKLDEKPDRIYWLCRLNGGIDDPAHCTALETKGGT